MKADVDREPASGTRIVLRLAPFTMMSFLGFLAVGIPLPVLPAMVHDTLGFGAVVVGLVVGLQSVATLLTRQIAGRLSDTRGARATGLAGLAAAAAAGVCYLLSSGVAAHPFVALGLLVLGRLVLGLGESLFITANSAWSIARVGNHNAGRAFAWTGIAMYGALALGAPVGLAAERAGGFAIVATCAILFPLVGVGIALRVRDAPRRGGGEGSFLAVLRQIWAFGLAMALSSWGVGTITAFLTLRYRTAGWGDPGLALTAFGIAYIVVRLVFGGLPDRLGGTTTAALSLVVEAAGLFVIWGAGTPHVAFAGAILVGLGYSLVFPSLGVEAMKRVAPEDRGLMVGAYLGCFDLGLAAGGPISGLVTQTLGLPAAFAAAGAAALAALALTVLSRS